MRRFLVVIQLIIAIALLAGMPGPAEAQRERRAPQQQAQTPKTEPMRVMLVRENPESCRGECREWISAEGDLTPNTPLEFERVFRQLGNRKVPILIHSRGGSVEAAQRIGRMIRARGLDIAVARTWFKECGTGSLTCPPPPPKQARQQRDRAPAAPIIITGLPEFAGEHSRRRAGCASACSYLIAGGVRRVAAEHARVGVHQITTTRTHVMRRYIVHYRMINGRRQQVSRQLVSTRPTGTEVFQPAANDPAYRRVKAYLASLGVSGELVDLGMNSGPKEMHYLSREELARTRVIDVSAKLEDLFRPATARQAAQLPVPAPEALTALRLPPSPQARPAPPVQAAPLPEINTPIQVGTVVGAAAFVLTASEGRTQLLRFEAVTPLDSRLVELHFTPAGDGAAAPPKPREVQLLFHDGATPHSVIGQARTDAGDSAPLVLPVERARFCDMRRRGLVGISMTYMSRTGVLSAHIKMRPNMKWEQALHADLCWR